MHTFTMQVFILKVKGTAVVYIQELVQYTETLNWLVASVSLNSFIDGHLSSAA